MRKLVACLACRNQGTRLYGKPLQNIDVENRLTILEYLVESIKTYKPIDDIVIGAADGLDNLVYERIANELNVKFILGDEKDVLDRLIKCCEHAGGTDIHRLTTESPFKYFEAIEKAWEQHVTEGNDLTALDHLPDGSGLEIIRLDAYKRSWELGDEKHRSEFCSLYIRENKEDFKIGYVDAPDEIRRTDIRLTVDNPEDLVLCRAIYKEFKQYAPNIPLHKIIKFLDKNVELKNLVDHYVEEGLKTMYI